MKFPKTKKKTSGSIPFGYELTEDGKQLQAVPKQIKMLQDAIDGVIALGWEDEDSDAVVNHKFKRLVFHYGDSVKSVEDKLYERDIVLNYEKSFSEHE